MENNTNDEKNQALLKVIRQLLGLVSGLILLVLLLFMYILYVQPTKPIFGFFSKKPEIKSASAEIVVAKKPEFWTAPEITSLESNPDKEKIIYGKMLVAHTALYFGPQGTIKKNATNGMNCQNCHLDAGTKVFGNNYGSVFSTYPKYRARSGGFENIHKRINDCFERSLNGLPLDTSSKEMEAMAAYINWLGKDVTKGEKASGSGFKDLPFLDRPADPEKGKLAYDTKCVTCHKLSGEGHLNPENTAFAFPPLWGNNSFNTGAGLYRISNFAKFIKYNMPLGASHSNPMLSDEEAWDIAAYVNSQPRTIKTVKADWPKIEEKPFDHPFGPYADGFDEKEHKYGPYKAIKEKLEAMKKSRQ